MKLLLSYFLILLEKLVYLVLWVFGFLVIPELIGRLLVWLFNLPLQPFEYWRLGIIVSMIVGISVCLFAVFLVDNKRKAEKLAEKLETTKIPGIPKIPNIFKWLGRM